MEWGVIRSELLQAPFLLHHSATHSNIPCPSPALPSSQAQRTPWCHCRAHTWGGDHIVMHIPCKDPQQQKSCTAVPALQVGSNVQKQTATPLIVS